MLLTNQEQHLGYKAFLVLAFRHISSGIILVILSIFIVAFSKSLLFGILSSVITGFGVTKSIAINLTSEILIIFFLVIVCLGILVCFLGIIISYLEYRNYTYRFDEFDLTLKRGILDIKENSVPYRQIQNVDIERSIGYQLFGLSKLVIKTAGTEEGTEREMTEIKIEPIDKNVAEEIQSMLERKIGVQIVENDTIADKEEKNNFKTNL